MDEEMWVHMDPPSATRTDREILLELRDAVYSMKTEIEASKTFIEKIQAEIGPILEKLQSNSMFKMMFGGK